MSANKNMFFGIIMSFTVHGAAFIHWNEKFDLNHNVDYSSSQKKEINIQLVKMAKPEINKISFAPQASVLKKINPVSKKAISQPTKKIPNIKPKSLVKPVTDDTEAVDHPEKTDSAQDIENRVEAEKRAQKAEQKIMDDKIKAEQKRKAFVAAQKKQERENYLKQLLAHIESYKFYPGTARRRAIEGTLKVSFNLLKQGGFKHLSIEGGKSILQRAVKQAMNDAMPLPKPPDSFNLTNYIEFNMKFELKKA